MSRFSTRNSDGASSLAEGRNTISPTEMRRLSAVAKRHNPAKTAVFTPEGTAYSRAHDVRKAGTN